MARNPNIGKLKRQKARRKLGPFRTYSDPSVIDPEYLQQQTKLKGFWAERITSRPNGGGQSGVDRSQIPDAYRGYVDYRGHAKTLGRGEDHVNGSPPEFYWLKMMFPGARFVSVERTLVLEQVREIIGSADPTSCIVAERTRFRITYLYYNPTKTLWWFVEQDKFTIRTSITYGSQDRARAVQSTGSVRWRSSVTFQPDSS